MPRYCRPLEVGVGTGRFAQPLGIGCGVEPSRAMADVARSRGVDVTEAAAEAIPFDEGVFDLVLMVTTVCFLDDINRAFSESLRVLIEGGHIVVGFLDRATELGQTYEARKVDSGFYRLANFCSSSEVLAALTQAGFDSLSSVQTIFDSVGDVEGRSSVKPGHGTGLFAVVRGRK